uniref:CYP94D79 n=1 Tax=Taxus chinensis TaxID=29808 RepID=A0A291FB25_TAXCH|nr:CYP94D79 [Taxus chinensis]
MAASGSEACFHLLLHCITIACTLLLIAHLFHKKSKSQEKHGFTHHPLLGVLPSLIKNQHRIHDWITDTLLTSPSNTSLIRGPFGIRGYMTANPENVEHLLKTNFENYEKGRRQKILFHDFLGRGIFNVDGELWKMQRKAASYEFNTKSLRSFVIETVQREIGDRLVPLLSNVCNGGGSVNLQDVFQRFTFDNICSVAFGVDPACLHPSLPQVPFARAFDDATELSFGRIFYSAPFAWRIKKLLDIGSERRLRQAIAVVDDFALSVIRSRRKEIAENHESNYPLRNDLLSRFMAALDDHNGENLERSSDLFLRDMIVNFMLAGRDTASTSLTWFFWLLSSHPAVEDTIRHEIMEVLAKRRENPKGVAFNYEELREMQYLHAAVCESLRLYPPVPLDSKVAVQKDVLPDGNVVRRGWSVDYSIYAMGRMKSIWGQDCLEFKPQRWLKNGEFVGESPYKFVAFNAGPRICLGKEMSMIQMKSIVACIIHGYSVKVDPGFVARYTLDFNMRIKGGMPVTLTKT